jgi:hypothetical protein
MVMMAATIVLLFSVGFAGGYFARAALSWVRRNRLKRLRAERQTEALLKETAVAAPVQANAPLPAAAGHANA